MVVSVRDAVSPTVGRVDLDSDENDTAASGARRRLLCVTLTDGHAEIVGVEAAPLPKGLSARTLIPGTKVLLEETQRHQGSGGALLPMCGGFVF